MFDNNFFSFDELNKNTENINKKLSENNNSPKLEDLLIEDGLIDELKNKNEKLINYFNQNRIKQMLDYIIKEPKEDDYNEGHKFPFICSKLFNVEEIKIMNYFFKTNKELINEKNENKNYELNNSLNIDIDKNEEKEEEINEENKEDLFFELIKDIDDNEKANVDINDKEINIDDVINTKIESNVIKDEIINSNNKENNLENTDETNLKEMRDSDNNKTYNDNNENNKQIKEKKLKNKYIEDIIIPEDKQFCIFKSSTECTLNNNYFDNKRYDIFSNTNSKIEIENKNNNKKEEEEIDINYPEDRIEILDYFLSFLLNDSELNYVLCGYFYSLMINLLNINSNLIIKYLFLKRKDILKKLVYHSYRKSIAEILCKIIKYEDIFKEQNENIHYDEKKFSKIRLEIIREIFDKINIDMDIEKLFSLSVVINDLSRNKKILESIVNNKDIIKLLITKQLKDINLNRDEIKDENSKIEINNIKNNFIIISDIIINWLNYIKFLDIQIPMVLYEVSEDYNEDGDFVQQKEIDKSYTEVHHTILSKALFDILPNLIHNNFNKIKNGNDNIKNDNSDINYIIQSYNNYKLKPLGLYKIKILEILTSLIFYCKNIPNEYDNILINSYFFENAINYIFEYQWNNLYQEALYQFFKQLFIYNEDCPYHEKSSEYLFSKLNLLKIIISNFNKINNNNDGNSQNGFTSFLVRLSYKINTIIGGNYLNLNKNNSMEGSITFINFENNSGKDIELFFDLINIKNNKNNNEKYKKKEIKPVNCLKKYCNEEWNNFFKLKIANKIKLYEEKLCEQKNNNHLSETNILFNNSYNKNKNEDLLGLNEDEKLFRDNNKNDNDLIKNEINNNNDIHINNNNKDIDKFKDLEINLNDFINIDEDRNNLKCKNENNDERKGNKDKNENNEYNSFNYWKISLEEENNSYLKKIGEEALNDLKE